MESEIIIDLVGDSKKVSPHWSAGGHVTPVLTSHWPVRVQRPRRHLRPRHRRVLGLPRAHGRAELRHLRRGLLRRARGRGAVPQLRVSHQRAELRPDLQPRPRRQLRVQVRGRRRKIFACVMKNISVAGRATRGRGASGARTATTGTRARRAGSVCRARATRTAAPASSATRPRGSASVCQVSQGL